MEKNCPFCGEAIIREQSNFCASCGKQIRELSPEDAALVPPEHIRLQPMPVVKKVVVDQPRPDFYAFLFGPIQKGAGYLGRMIVRWLETGQPIEQVDYNALLKDVCDAKGVKVASAKRAIQRFLEACWEQGYQESWEKYAGWSGAQPPDVSTAMRLVLESYAAYYAAYVEAYKKRFANGETGGTDSVIEK